MNNAVVLLSESGSVIDRLQGLGDAKKQLADPDYWSSVGIIALTGILVVFLILAILIFVFWLMGTIFKAIDKSKSAKAEAKKNTEAAAAKPVVSSVEAEPAVGEDYTDDEEIVAVISAAIAAYTEQSFTIKSIRKHDSRARSAWSTAGISENTRPF
ncbi:MAG: OadG family protein [Oscillospiraceae bacterium]|nr:OadG family protein [Oscillospiraceae bacterium]